jgi:hypothetical protein
MLTQTNLKDVIYHLGFHIDKPNLLIAIENAIDTTLDDETANKIYEIVIQELVQTLN